jgi:hypothetical protein
MTINLTSYGAIESHLFVRIQVDEYRTSTIYPYSEQVLRFSDRLTPFTINEEEYIGLGKLMGITSSSSEIRVSAADLTITISGIPTNSIGEIVNSKIKGCPVKIYRALFDAETGAYLDIEGNPLGRFRGFVNNYSLNEEWDNTTKTASNTLVLTCSSAVNVLQNKVAGRKTNPESQKRFYPNDVSMDRVPNLENSTFNFGAPL